MIMNTLRQFSAHVKLLTLLLVTMAAFNGSVSAQSTEGGGSILIFPYYGSSLSNPVENTVITISNFGSASRYVKLFFRSQNAVSQGCLLAKLQLAPYNSHIIKMKDYDPGVIGSIFAFAVDANDIPIKANDLSGVAVITRYASDQTTVIKHTTPAFQIKRLADASELVSGGFVTLSFNGTEYERLPATVSMAPLLVTAEKPAFTALAVPHTLSAVISTDTPLRFPALNYGAYRGNTGCNLSYTVTPGLTNINPGTAGPHSYSFGTSGGGYNPLGFNWASFMPFNGFTGFVEFTNLDTSLVAKPMVGFYQSVNGSIPFVTRSTVPSFDMTVEVNSNLVCS